MDCEIIQQQYRHFKNPFANKKNYVFFIIYFKTTRLPGYILQYLTKHSG